MKVPFPHVWDSTIVATGRSCEQKLFRQYFEHWKSKYESEHLIAGSAFADGVETMRRSYYEHGITNRDQCLGDGLRALMLRYGDYEPPKDSLKTCERMMGALEFYADKWPLGNDRATPITYGGKLGVEFSFCLPLPVLHPVSGQPLLYSGRCDMVANAYGGIWPHDEKTASQLGKKWGSKWDLRSQFTGYCWGLKNYGIKATGVVVRGISILTNKYEHAQALTYRSDWEIERWLKTLCYNLERWKIAWQKDEFIYDLDHACDEFGGCTFKECCKSKNPEDWLPVFCEKRVWDPIARSQVALPVWEARWAQENQS